MKLTPVIAALRARCPYFENRVAGAAQFKNLPEVGKLKLPAAYVVPGDDSPGENKSQTDYWQELKEGFSVVVILSNGRDERGQFPQGHRPFASVSNGWMRRLTWRAASTRIFTLHSLLPWADQTLPSRDTTKARSPAHRPVLTL